MVLLLWSVCAVAQEVRSLDQLCPSVAGNGISLADMSGTDTRRLRLDLVLESIRLCPKEFVAVASRFPASDSPVSAIQGLMRTADQSAVAAARVAAARIAIPERETEAAVARQLKEVLGKPEPAIPPNLAELERRDSEDLARMAAGQASRTGEHQGVLLLGIFVVWVANRTAVNAAFESVPSSQEWLRPFPPGVAMVGGDAGSDGDELEKAVIRQAQANDGPIDRWYRRFRVEQ